MTKPRPRARRSDRAPDRTPSAPRRDDTSRGVSAIPATVWVLEPGQLPRDAVVRRLQHWSGAPDHSPDSAVTPPILALTVAPGHVPPTPSSTVPPADGADAERADRPHRPTGSSGPSPGPASGSGPRHGPARPFWADMVAAAAIGPGRHPLLITLPRGGSPLSGSGAGSGEVSLLVVEHGSEEAGDDLGRRAAQLLAPGGLLAVLSRHGRAPTGDTSDAGATSEVGEVGALLDPTGSIVASAQNADLLYLQHIVLVPRHPVALQAAASSTRPSRPARVPEPLDATGEHIDLCLFLRPPAPTPATGADAAPRAA